MRDGGYKVLDVEAFLTILMQRQMDNVGMFMDQVCEVGIDDILTEEEAKDVIEQIDNSTGYWVVTTCGDRNSGPWDTEEEAWDEICRIRARCVEQEEFENVAKYTVEYE